MYRTVEKKAMKETKIGNRCRICTGCGRCFGRKEGIRIVTGQEMTMEWQEQAGETLDWLAAVDIGTTTIAMVLYDRQGRERDQFVTVNPQTRYGADVLSRIQAAGAEYAQETGGPEVAEEAASRMREGVHRVLEEGIVQFRRFMEAAGEAASLRMSIAANTTMVYLLMGWDPRELGQAPFHATRLREVQTFIAGVPAVILPGLSAFVGSDIAAGIYACSMTEREGVTLLIDLGTNGEMAVGGPERILACSTAAGPAFEGGATKGIWGADMVSLTARLLEEGILDGTGLLAEEYFDDGVRIGDVLITQQDIRGLQLAKGAIAAGIDILLEQYGPGGADMVERVVLAGGFGYYLKAEDAGRIGLLPASLVPKVCSGGNMALAGAKRYGRQTDMAGRALQCPGGALKVILERTQVINLAEIKGFNERYVEAMFLEPR